MSLFLAGNFAAKLFPRSHLTTIKTTPIISSHNHLKTPHRPTMSASSGDDEPLSKFPNLNGTAAAAAANAAFPGDDEPLSKIPKLNSTTTTAPPPPLLMIKKLSDRAVLPSRASPHSAGYDLSSAADTTVPARGKALVPTDLSIAIPLNTYARIAPRSGLAWRHAIGVGAGVIDADYRGPVGVVLFNHSDVDFEVKAGDRIAQLIIERIMTLEVAEVDDLDSTVRGDGGFGSTGV